MGTVTAYKYEIKGNSSFEQTITSSRENGTTFFDQTLNLTLKKLTVQDHKELKLMSYGRPHVVVHDYNGNAATTAGATASSSSTSYNLIDFAFATLAGNNAGYGVENGDNKIAITTQRKPGRKVKVKDLIPVEELPTIDPS